jgi:hypothetical protein
MNVKSQYRLRRNVMHWMLKVFSAKFILLVFLGLLSVQFVNYGVLDRGQFWVPKPGFTAHMDFISRYVVWPHIWYLVAAILIDFLTWPILFRSELE